MSKIIIIFVFSLLMSKSYAFSISEFVDKAKSQVNTLINGKPKVEKPSIVLPKIPKISKDAKSVDVYSKKGKIYTQGASFKKLSQEKKRKYRIAFIEELFIVTKEEDVSNSDLKSKLNMLEQGGTREGIYRLLVLDTTYRRLEASDQPSSDKLIDFTVDFGNKYLGRSFSPELVRKLNLWGIKKIIVEKSLETMDELAKNENDLYSWYAVLSSDLAVNYKQIWKNKTRKNTARNFHYRWAKKVPFQLIKSEVIIKIHKVMNSLN